MRAAHLVRTAFAALALAACSPAQPEPLPFEPAGPGVAPDPSTFGPFPVGVRTVAWSDATRPDAMGNPRPILTEIWYPADESARGQKGAKYELRPLLTPDQQRILATTDLPIQTTTAVRDARPRFDRAPYPLVVFSHGHGGMRWQSTYYTVVLASHGYVVAAPDHFGDTLSDGLANALAPTLVEVQDRPLDVSFLIGRLTSLPATDPLAGLSDAARVGVTGHSFGALTSLRVAALDRRVKAIVPQAPTDVGIAWFDQPPGFKLSIPVLIEAAHDDRTLPWDTHVAPTWARMVPTRALLDITHGGHFSFSDLCAFDLSHLAGALGQASVVKALADGCTPPAPPASVAQPLIDHFAIGFFNATLRGSDASWALLVQARADALAPGEATFVLER